jgi:hypothetical protein
VDLLALLAALLVLTLALASRAEAFIYWANHDLGGGSRGTIARANLDGTGVDESFIDVFTEGAVPTGIAVDANHRRCSSACRSRSGWGRGRTI